MTNLTTDQLHERAMNKLDARLVGRYRDLKEYENYKETGHFKLSEDLIDTCIDAMLREIDTLEYIREAVEVYSNLSTFNRK